MGHFRCVIANMPQQMLADIVENVVEESGEIEVVKRLTNVDDIHTVLASGPVDLLVLGMKSTDLPKSCRDIMDQTPGLAIMGLIDDGRKLACFVNDVGKVDIVKIVQSICRASRVYKP